MKLPSPVQTLLQIVFLLVSFMFVVTAHADSAKGVGEVQYKGWFGPGKKDHQAAYQEARFNAIQRYLSKQGSSQVKLLDQQRETVLAQLDDIILDTTLIDEDINKSLKQLRITVKAEINVPMLTSLLEPERPEHGSNMSFVFVAREQSSIESHRDTETLKVDKRESSRDTGRQASADGGFQSESSKSGEVSKSGSTVRHAEDVQYRVTTTQQVNAAMSDIFSESGFEVVDAVYLEDASDGRVSIESFRRDYSSGDDIDPTTLTTAVDGMRDLDIQYFAMGTLDVGLHDKDPQTGLVRVYVVVSGQVKSLKNRFPKTVASVGPVQYAGLGPSATVARNNALKLAAKEAAAQLTAQLHSKKMY